MKAITQIIIGCLLTFASATTAFASTTIPVSVEIGKSVSLPGPSNLTYSVSCVSQGYSIGGYTCSGAYNGQFSGSTKETLCAAVQSLFDNNCRDGRSWCLSRWSWGCRDNSGNSFSANEAAQRCL